MRATVVSSFGDTFRIISEDGGECVCRARGVLRTKGSIVPGDAVEAEDSGGETVIAKVYSRRNEIVRPPLANLEQLVFVCAAASPPPDLYMLDRFTAVAVFKGISPVLVFTKTDVGDAEKYVEIYRGVFPVFTVNNLTGEGVSELYETLRGKISALAGNSGVGKSSLINCLCPWVGAETGEISQKLGRGKNTTRRTELIPLPDGGFVADTPGFAAFSTERYDIIYKEELAGCFPELDGYAGKCRFQDCSHTKEQGCAVLEAVEKGIINPSRHRSYVMMYAEAMKLKPWEIKRR